MSEPINIRASSISGIFDCPLRSLSIQTGAIKQMPTTAPACIGSACHESTAAFDLATINGDPITPYDASEIAEDYIRNPPEEVNWTGVTEKQALSRALGVHTRYCEDVAPIMTYQHAELTLDPLVVDVDGIYIELTGTLDRVYSESNQHGILDIKTGVRVISQKPEKHLAQIGVYELLAERTLGVELNLPGMIGRLQTSSDYDVDVVKVENARNVLLGTDGQIGLLGHIGHMLKTGDWYGNTSSWLCSDKYCGLYNSCFFRGKQK